jgi:hypothetical protein
MADIFISYSKPDRDLTLKLAAYLQSEGWSVWWDKSLGAGDAYRDEIMKQLAVARAVITIWSKNSIQSDWVRAESGRAKADGKLIPVKTADVTYPDIPLPFGEMHTENFGATELIRAAVVAQLSKPTVPPSFFRQITSAFKYHALTWIGIIGGTITLFTNLREFLYLADWAKAIAQRWQEWSAAFWTFAFQLVGFKFPKEFAPTLSFAASVAALAIGTNLSLRKNNKSLESVNFRRSTKSLLKGVVIYSLGMFIFFAGVKASISIQSMELALKVSRALWVLVLIWSVGFPVVYLSIIIKERVWVLVASFLFLIFAGCLLFTPLLMQAKTLMPPPIVTVDDGDERTPEQLEEDLQRQVETGAKQLRYYELAIEMPILLLFQILWMSAVLLSPLKKLTHRLTFVVVGVFALFLLNELSKFNLHEYLVPPSGRGHEQ